MDTTVTTALAASNLGGVSPELMNELLAGARQSVIRGGATFHREGEPTAHLELVVSGLARVLITAPDGRTMTVRYCRPGALLGAMSLFTSGFTMPASVQALTETRLLHLQPDAVRSLAREPRVADALIRELAERAREFLGEIAGGTFGTVRQRVVRHLVDLAVLDGADPSASDGLVVHASQQELAEATGTVREVVVRILRELRDDDLVQTSRGRILLLDIERLLLDKWNLGS